MRLCSTGALDARRNEVYTALYCDGQRLGPDRAIAPAQLAEELTQLSAPVTFSGDGVDPYRTLFAEALGANFQLPADGNTLFFAAAAARLAYAKYAAGEISDVAALVPVYLRYPRQKKKRLRPLSMHDIHFRPLTVDDVAEMSHIEHLSFPGLPVKRPIPMSPVNNDRAFYYGLLTVNS